MVLSPRRDKKSSKRSVRKSLRLQQHCVRVPYARSVLTSAPHRATFTLAEIAFFLAYATPSTFEHRVRTCGIECLFMALFGHGAMSDLGPLCALERTWKLIMDRLSRYYGDSAQNCW